MTLTTTNNRRGMRKAFLCAALAALLLSGCETNPENNDNIDAPKDRLIRFEQHGELTASASSYYSNGFLYYHENGYLSYMNVETGATNTLCWDPLCLHDEQHIYSTCPAITFDDGFLRVLEDDGMVWFTAWDYIERSDGFSDMVYQLRSLDIKTNKLTVYFEKNDVRFFDFWRYNGNTYITMPQVYTDEEGRIYTRGGALCRLEKNGTLTTLMAAEKETDNWTLCAVDENGLYVMNTQTGECFRTDEQFAHKEAVSGKMNGNLYDGYVYYLERTDNKQTAEGKTVDVEIMEDFSVLDYKTTEYRLMRCAVDGDAEPEELYSPVRMPESNITTETQVFWIDRDNGKIYIVPCDLVWKDYILWEETSPVITQQMQVTKPILTNIFSVTNGRLVELDPETMQTRDILYDTGSDIVDIYAITDGKIAAEFKLYDPAQIRELQERGELQSSRLDYRYNDVIDLD